MHDDSGQGQDEPAGDAPSFSDVDSSSDEARAAALAALDVQAQLPPIQRLHAWLLEQLDPLPGMHVMDVGCGTGEDVRGLAVSVAPTGSATGVDPSGTMLAEARRRGEAARNPARFVSGSADRLPVADAALDLVRSERVLQHLTDPVVAVREMARALRPGGRVGLIDTDWRTLATWPGDPHMAAVWRESWGGGPSPAAGAQLLDLVLRHGFVDARVTTEVLMLRPRDLGQPPVSMVLEEATRRAEAAGEGASWRQDLEQSAAQGSFVFSVTLYAVVATRA
ncbi:methyltransferase domain-containing protein [Nocardioides daphniae]|uniref:Methyltransferase domain-containing protein n=1 Tax=Nocardioides daphniae TaxID=402297 RepID=A0A4P7U9U0_9ACTN|nr:methyltransferase domain-containing protein [Nocardioides daphniae]QCC76832.1 methyltransferase domain-containing protein [Nocardioides daphniae]